MFLRADTENNGLSVQLTLAAVRASLDSLTQQVPDQCMPQKN